MSLVADRLAVLSNNPTTASTDNTACRDLVYLTSGNDESKLGGLQVLWKYALPVPGHDMELSKMIAFRNTRRDELLRFRKFVREFMVGLAQTESVDAAKDTCAQFKEEIEVGVNDITKLMNESGIRFVLGSIKTLINLKSPALWGTILVAAGGVTDVADVPLEYSIPGLGFAAGVQVTHSLFNDWTKRRTDLACSPFSYLYHAEKDLS